MADNRIDEPTEVEGEDTFRPGVRGFIAGLLWLVLLLWGADPDGAASPKLAPANGPASIFTS